MLRQFPDVMMNFLISYYNGKKQVTDIHEKKRNREKKERNSTKGNKNGRQKNYENARKKMKGKKIM